MSHLKERNEKVCLNCNAAIYGRYCHVCGQENIEPKESFWHLVTHFFFDLIHFDGKFFSTLKYLLFKPGFLAAEHLKGRRADYLHPIRLYIFVSAFFFLIVFSFYSNEHESKKNYYNSKIKKLEVRKQITQKQVYKDTISLAQKQIQDSFLTVIDADIAKLKIDSSQKTVFLSDSLDYSLLDKSYEEVNINLNLSFIEKYMDKKRKNYSSATEFNKQLTEILLHSIPKGLFFALPFYALFLMLFYVRNKSYNYVNHLIFSIYLFCFTFILVLINMWLTSLLNWANIDVDKFINLSTIIIAIVYTYKGLRFFYKQSIGKKMAKFILLSFSCIVIITITTILLFLYSLKAV